MASDYRPGAAAECHVTHRRGYLADAVAPQPVEWGEAEWRTAIANPLSSSVVRLDGQIAPAGTAPRVFDFRMQIALDDLHFRQVDGKFVADIEIVTAEKIATAIFHFVSSTQRSGGLMPIQAC